MEQATSLITNELDIRLFLFGLAALSFYEALKLERPTAYIAWVAFLLFLIAGFAFTPIANEWPKVAEWLGRLAGNPVTWFVLVMSAYLVIRPHWTTEPDGWNSTSVSTENLTNAIADSDVISDIASRLNSVVANVETQNATFVDYQKSLGDVLAQRFHTLEQSIDKRLEAIHRDSIEAEAGQITSRRLQREKLNDMVSKIAALSEMHSQNFIPISGMMDGVRKTIDRYVQILLEAGFAPEELSDQFKHIAQDVKSDAIFADISADVGKFETVEQKREWEVRRRKIILLDKLVKAKLSNLGSGENDLQTLKIA